MKIKTVVLAVCLSLVLTGMTTTGECGPQKGDIFISPMVGGHMFEGTMGIEDGPMGALGLGYMATDRCGLEAVLGYTMTETTIGALDTNVGTGRLDAFYNLMTGDFVPYFAIGVGAVNFDYDIPGVENDMDWMANYGLGCHYFFTDSLALRADVRHAVSFDETQNHLLYTLGLTWLLGGGDDGTQVVKMKPAPEKATVAVTEAPKPAPAPAPVVPQIADADRDGVADDKDACPGTPAGAKVDARGCWVIEGLNFATSRADIMADSFARLDEVVTVLKQNPNLKLEIQGHTDSRGSETFNKMLSEQRAGAVLRYFVSKGIAAERLVAKGFGSSQPVADNDTAEGRAENRRVELNPID